MSEEVVDVLRVMNRDTELHLALRNDPEANEESWNTRAIVAELIAADREYDAALLAWEQDDSWSSKAVDQVRERLTAATARRAAILSRIKD